MLSQINFPALIAIIGVLVALVNIVTQVLKQVTWDKLPTNFLVLILSVVLTLVFFFAYCAMFTIAVLWYYIAGAVVVGFLVAYAAMFGYDKLKEILSNLNTGV